jgi:hypothetical protein
MPDGFCHHSAAKEEESLKIKSAQSEWALALVDLYTEVCHWMLFAVYNERTAVATASLCISTNESDKNGNCEKLSFGVTRL